MNMFSTDQKEALSYWAGLLHVTKGVSPDSYVLCQEMLELLSAAFCGYKAVMLGVIMEDYVERFNETTDLPLTICFTTDEFFKVEIESAIALNFHKFMTEEVK